VSAGARSIRKPAATLVVMEVLGFALTALLLAAGLVGSVVPALPGTALIVAGALVHALVTDFAPIGTGRLLILAGLSVAGESLDYLAGALGARKFGGSRWAQAGAWAGGIVGFFFGLPGLLLGPVVGAATAELLRQRALAPSVKVGLGTLLGVVTGIAAKFTVAVVMVALFVWWVVRG